MTRIATIGIDPGRSGGMCTIIDGGNPAALSFTTCDLFDVRASLQSILAQCSTVTAWLEDVHAMPAFAKQQDGQDNKVFSSATSQGKLMQSKGELIGLLVGLGIPHRLVSPMKWQTYFGTPGKGSKGAVKKRALKEAACRLYPSAKITLATADAILIARYGLMQSKGVKP